VTVDGIAPLGAGVPAADVAREVSAVVIGDESVREYAGGAVLQGECLRASFDPSGLLRSLVDRASGREYIAASDSANTLQLFLDTPARWDAWDIDAGYRNTPIAHDQAAALEVVGQEVRIRRSVASSAVSQTVRLSPDGRALEFETVVDWHEQRRMLKLGFAFDVHATVSTSEIQFGHIDRPTHANTSWDAARFEISGHRWVRIADATAGVTVANDRVYGRDVTRTARPGGGTTTTVRETLLRAPTFPDPGADQGQHVFRHSVRPGDLAGGIAEGYRLNRPLRRVSAAVVEPLVRVEAPGVLVETVKLAADGSGDVIVRLYESCGGQACGRLHALFPVASAWRADLLEESLGSVAADPFELELRAFEIVTVRISRA
jgi:alpha-mannosidase